MFEFDTVAADIRGLDPSANILRLAIHPNPTLPRASCEIVHENPPFCSVTSSVFTFAAPLEVRTAQGDSGIGKVPGGSESTAKAATSLIAM